MAASGNRMTGASLWWRGEGDGKEAYREERRLYSCFGSSFSTHTPSAFFRRTVKHAMPVYSVLAVSIAPLLMGYILGYRR